MSVGQLDVADEQEDQPLREAPGSGGMFNQIAERYDVLNRVISFGLDSVWRHAAIASLGPVERARVLDLATGTGDLAIQLAEAGSYVVGIDPSEAMLAVASRKVVRAHRTYQIRLEAGVAETLPFGRDTFDAGTIAFGIRNFTDRAQSLAELARVIKPSGRLAILELSEPRGLFSGLARAHVHHVVPRIGALLSSGDEYRYLRQSIRDFPAPTAFADLMERAGFAVDLVRPFAFGACVLYGGCVTGAAR